MTYLFGLPRPLPYANAVQLVLTLKAVGLSFEIHDSYMRKTKLFKLESNSRTGDDPNAKKEAESINLELKYISITKQPSILEMISYQYCYIGILTGPYFKFKTYQDWLNTKYSQNLNESLKFVLKRNKSLDITIAKIAQASEISIVTLQKCIRRLESFSDILENVI